ncbi:MAG: glycerol kinase GlpK, partial [Bdellovibrionales bacterium]|nr:glycerol kinase GlpK [Bdellovibrionales bacterium]
MKNYILAVDQGTTATTVLLINRSLQVVARESTEILPSYPKYSWVDHDLNAIWRGTLATIDRLVGAHGVDPSTIAAIGITNQRETVGAWSRATGEPLAPAIVWQCRRTSDRCLQLRKDPAFARKFRATTGLVLDPYFSFTKVEWLLKNVPGLKERARAGDAVFGTIDSWLLFKLTGGAAHATDPSNASRWGLMDLRSLRWDASLLKKFSIPAGCLPEIRSSSEHYGATRGIDALPDGIPVAGILGDQQAALFGQLCTKPGMGKCTYGTGAFMLVNAGAKPPISKNGLLSTVAWRVGKNTEYALEGSAFVAGAAVQWVRDNLGIISKSSDIEALASAASDAAMGDLVFVPALAGLGAPHWDPGARGMLHGITRGTTREHIARAVLEGIALQIHDLAEAMRKDLRGVRLKSIKVDGGASANDFLMQTQSDVCRLPLIRPKVLDTTALGSAMMAGLAVGFWRSVDDLAGAWASDRIFEPSGDKLGSSVARSQLVICRNRDSGDRFGLLKSRAKRLVRVASLEYTR